MLRPIAVRWQRVSVFVRHPRARITHAGEHAPASQRRQEGMHRGRMRVRTRAIASRPSVSLARRSTCSSRCRCNERRRRNVLSRCFAISHITVVSRQLYIGFDGSSPATCTHGCTGTHTVLVRFEHVSAMRFQTQPASGGRRCSSIILDIIKE